MKNKKLILGGSIILGGGLLAYFFLRKKPTSLSDIKPELKTANNLPIQKDILETTVVQKDNTEQFNMLFKTYNEIKKQVDEQKGKSFFGKNTKLDNLKKDLKDFEYKIIALGYTPTGSGTFTKDNNSFIQKGNTEEEFNMLYRTYRSLEQQIIDKDKPIPLNILNGYGRKAGGTVLRKQQEDRDKQLQRLRDALRDVEQNILNLGYKTMGRGTFYKR